MNMIKNLTKVLISIINKEVEVEVEDTKIIAMLIILRRIKENNPHHLSNILLKVTKTRIINLK